MGSEGQLALGVITAAGCYHRGTPANVSVLEPAGLGSP